MRRRNKSYKWEENELKNRLKQVFTPSVNTVLILLVFFLAIRFLPIEFGFGEEKIYWIDPGFGEGDLLGDIWTDNESYVIPGGIVYIDGSDFTPFADVEVDIKDSGGVSVDGYPKNVVSTSSGNITDTWIIPNSTSVGVYTISAVDQSNSSLNDSVIINITFAENVNNETLQPGAAEGIDTFVNQNAPNTNYGSNTMLVAGESGGKYAGILIKFNLSHIPSNANVIYSGLKLYFFNSPTNPTNPLNLSTRRITSDWDESTVTWNTRPSYTSAYSDKASITNNYGWVEWDVTDGVQGIVDGAYTNYGIGVVPDTGTASTDKRFRSSDYSNASLRPILEVNYIIPEAPNILIIWPSNNTQHGDGDAYIAYNVTGDNAITNCSLIVNGNVQDTDSTITKNIMQIFKKTTNNNVTYQVSVNCTDSEGMVGTSGIISVTINTSKADLYGRVKDSQNNDVDITINFTQNGLTKYTSSGEIHAVVLDDGTYNITIVPDNHAISDITFEGVNITQGFTKIVDLDEPTDNQGFKKIYAIDPTKINFARAVVKRIAAGKVLFKCQSWNFSTRTCTDGKWKKLQKLVPGQKYNFTMLVNDPGFGESNDSVVVLDSGDYLIDTNETILANNSGIYDVELIPLEEINDTIEKIIVYGHNESADQDELKVSDNFTLSDYSSSYSIDPTNLSFDNATVKVTAQGKKLYKCTDWNSTAQTCTNGKWQKIKSIQPGQGYNFTLTQEDPGFGERNDTIGILSSGDYLVNADEVVSQNNETNLVDIKITPENHTIEKIIIYGHNESTGQDEIKVSDNFTLTGYSNSYSLDPTNLSFDNATITVTAANTSRNKILYKCLDWNFTTQTCYGSWTAWRSIVPGQEYNFTINSTDPGLAEGNGTFFEGFEGAGYENTGWTVVGGGTWDPDDADAYAGLEALEVKDTGGALAWDEINISTENYTNIIFSFYYKTAGTFEAGDYIAADYWNGSAWINVLNTSNVDTYTLDNNSLGSDADNNPNFKIRLACLNDHAAERCRWDNVQVSGTEAVEDTTNPIINWINDTPDPVDPGATINITANITDNVEVSAAWVEIDGTNYSMTQSGSSDIWYYDGFDTSLPPQTINYTVYANDTTNNPATPQSGNFTINALISISLTSAPINFTSVQPGSQVNASSGNGWPVYVTNNGNVNENVSVKGTNLIGQTSPSYTINVVNVQWDTDEAFPTGNVLTFTYEQVIGNLTMDSNVTVYFRLNAPYNIISQNYTGNVSFTSVQT